MHWTHAISWSYRLLLWYADSFCGLSPETLLFIVSWTLMMVRRLFYSPLYGLSFVDLILDGQHAFAGLVVVNFTCWPLSLSLTLSSTARVCWTFIVIDKGRPSSAGRPLVNLVVNGQCPLGLLHFCHPRGPMASVALLDFTSLLLQSIHCCCCDRTFVVVVAINPLLL